MDALQQRLSLLPGSPCHISTETKWTSVWLHLFSVEFKHFRKTNQNLPLYINTNEFKLCRW